jgi:hypothetical protein
MRVLLLLTVVATTCVGCASTQPPPPAAELREYERLRVNEARANDLLASGTIHAGQAIGEVLALCKPYRIDFVDQYTFIEFYPVPNLHGLSLIAIDGKLVSARRWSCNSNEPVFETITRDEWRTAMNAYGPRVYGYREWER